MEQVKSGQFAPNIFYENGEPKEFSAIPMAMYADCINAVLEIVKHAGPNPCPPIVLGIGIGGTMDQAAVMSKKALLRDISVPHKDADYAKLEEEIMEMVNKLVLDHNWVALQLVSVVNIEWGATHIAGLPVAVTIMCHAARHAHVVTLIDRR